MKTILRLETAELSIDQAKSIAMISLIDDVKFEEYKETLLAAAELVRSKGITNIIFNRTRIKTLCTECRIWVKNEYLKVHIKPLIPKLNRVAVVNTTSAVGQLYGQAIYKSISIVYPSLSFKFFGKLENAMKWLEPKKAKTSARKTSGSSVDDLVLSQDGVSRKTKKQPALESVGQQPADIEKEQSNFFDRIIQMLFSGKN